MSAASVGASTPPLSAIVRGAWPRIVPAAELGTAYALDSVSNELTFITGPLLVSAVIAFAPADVLVMLAAACTLLGAVLIASVPAIERVPARCSRDNGERLAWLGPLASPPVRALLIVAGLDTFAFGAMQVGAAAAATLADHGEAVGLLAAALSLGAAVGGFVYGARFSTMAGRSQLASLHLAGGLVLLVASHAPGLLALGLLFAIFGLLSGPRDALQQLLLNEASASQSPTETFAWLNTFMWGGFGLGTVAAGQLAETAPSAALRSGAAAGLVAALLVVVLLAGTPPRWPSNEVA